MTPEGQSTLISIPGTARNAWDAAAAWKRASPERVSWSVSARAARPMASALSASCSGVKEPSEKVEWQWRSIMEKFPFVRPW